MSIIVKKIIVCVPLIMSKNRYIHFYVTIA